MKTIALPGLALVLCGLVSTASAQIRIGTVDIKTVLNTYYKTQDAEQKVSDQRSSLKKEMEDRLASLQKAVAEVQKLDAEVRRPELSASVRNAKQQELSDKVGRLNVRQRDDKDYRLAREKDLQDLSLRLHGEIAKDIERVVAERVKAERYDIVFDRTSPTAIGLPVVLYAKDSYDFTSDVVTALNKSKGMARPAATPKKVK